jgi:hypothetical protein
LTLILNLLKINAKNFSKKGTSCFSPFSTAKVLSLPNFYLVKFFHISTFSRL